MASKEIEVQSTSKPLNATQQRNLQRLVDNDFMDLRREIQADLNRRLRERLAKIDDEFGRLDKGQEFTERLEQLADDTRSRRDVIIMEARDAGLTPSSTIMPIFDITFSSYNTNWIKPGKPEQVNAVKQAHVTLSNSVSMVLDREKSKLDRTILLQTLVGADVVNGLSVAFDLTADILANMPMTADILSLLQEEFDKDKGALEAMGFTQRTDSPDDQPDREPQSVIDGH